MQESLSLPQCKNFNFLTVCTIDFPWFISSSCYGKKWGFQYLCMFWDTASFSRLPCRRTGFPHIFLASLGQLPCWKKLNYCFWIIDLWPLPFVCYYICLHLVFNSVYLCFNYVYLAAFGNSPYSTVTFCTDYTIALFEQAIRAKNTPSSVNWRSLRMFCHNKSNPALARSFGLFLSRDWWNEELGMCLPCPSKGASISKAGPNGLSWLRKKSLIFIFANLPIFQWGQRCTRHATTALGRSVWILCRCAPSGLSQSSGWSFPCEGNWGIESLGPKRTRSLVSILVAELFSHRECHGYLGLVWGCRLWHQIPHSFLTQVSSLESEKVPDLVPCNTLLWCI